MAEAFYIFDVKVFQAGELRGLMAHHLHLLGAGSNHKGACTLKIAAKLCALI
jgi:hypothetical protein